MEMHLKKKFMYIICWIFVFQVCEKKLLEELSCLKQFEESLHI